MLRLSRCQGSTPRFYGVFKRVSFDSSSRDFFLGISQGEKKIVLIAVVLVTTDSKRAVRSDPKGDIRLGSKVSPAAA